MKNLALTALIAALITGCATAPPPPTFVKKDKPSSICRKNPYCERYTPEEWERQQMLEPAAKQPEIE